MKNRWYFLLILCFTACSKPVKPPPPSIPVLMAKPIVQDTAIYKEYIGHVEAFVKVEVKSQVEGVITGAYFTQGQSVKKGDLIITIDSRPYEAQLAKAEALLSENVANLRYAEDTAKRYAKLVQQDYVAQLQYDQYITNVLTSKASIKQSQADIETAKINISYCNISAPMDAVAGVLQVDVGNLIQNAQETPLVVLNQITPIYVYFSVPQQDLPQIQLLQRKSPLEVRAFLNEDFTRPFIGKLDLINNQVDEKTGTVLLRGIFPNTDQILWPGEFVDVRLILETKKEAILVPTESVQIGQQGYYAFIVDSQQTAQLRSVKIAQRMGKQVMIESGITKEDNVVIEGQINLFSGAKVTPKGETP